MNLEQRLAEIDRQCVPAQQGIERARAIVDRLLPLGRTPHGFFNPAGFIAASQRSGARSELFRAILPRVTAKARARYERTNP